MRRDYMKLDNGVLYKGSWNPFKAGESAYKKVSAEAGRAVEKIEKGAVSVGAAAADPSTWIA